MAIKSVYIEGSDYGVTRMFKGHGYDIAESDEEADLVVFTGGSDIMPFLYGETPMAGSFFNLKRDIKEIKSFKSLPPSKPKLGICRGGQLFNVLCGGSMYQDVDGHNGTNCRHKVKDFVSGIVIETNSVHHQMMIPGDNAFIIACAQAATVKKSQSVVINYSPALKRDWDDPEIVYYQNFNCLCYQAHPELDTAAVQTYFFGLMKTYLGNGG